MPPLDAQEPPTSGHRWYRPRRTHCVDCNNVIDKEPSSSRRTCTQCYSIREKVRLERKAINDNNRRKLKRSALIHDRLKSKPWTGKALDKREYTKLRRKLDPRFRLYVAYHKKLRKQKLCDSIRNGAKTGRSKGFLKKLGYTGAELRAHLEKQFLPGMTWEKFYSGDIEIDHITPLSKFNLDNEDDLRFAFSLPNLRPLWGTDNRKKGDLCELLL